MTSRPVRRSHSYPHYSNKNMNFDRLKLENYVKEPIKMNYMIKGKQKNLKLRFSLDRLTPSEIFRKEEILRIIFRSVLIQKARYENCGMY